MPVIEKNVRKMRRVRAEKVHLYAGVCICMAAADGAICTEELDEIVDHLIALSDRPLSHAELLRVLRAAQDEVKKQGIAGYLSRLSEKVDPAWAEELLAVAAGIVIADGRIDEGEREALRQVVCAFGLPEDSIDGVLALAADRSIADEDEPAGRA